MACNITFPISGPLSARPTIRIQSAWRTQRCVHGVKCISHWYSAILCWSSCCASHDVSRYSLFGSRIDDPKDFRIKSDVKRSVEPALIQNYLKLCASYYYETHKITLVPMCLLNIKHPCHNIEPHLFHGLNQSHPRDTICDKEFGKTCNNIKFIKKPTNPLWFYEHNFIT